MKTKDQAIRDAFGKSWHSLTTQLQNHILNVHHWVDRSQNRMNLAPKDLGFDENTECEVNCEFWRPIQLKGIENNNGWNKFNNEQLPEDMDCYVTNPQGNIVILSSNVINSISKDRLANITHYQILKKPEAPIY